MSECSCPRPKWRALCLRAEPAVVFLNTESAIAPPQTFELSPAHGMLHCASARAEPPPLTNELPQ